MPSAVHQLTHVMVHLQRLCDRAEENNFDLTIVGLLANRGLTLPHAILSLLVTDEAAEELRHILSANSREGGGCHLIRFDIEFI